jgi:hypothetical protein
VVAAARSAEWCSLAWIRLPVGDAAAADGTCDAVADEVRSETNSATTSTMAAAAPAAIPVRRSWRRRR